MVSEIAFSFLDTNTKAAVHKYLGSMTIEDAGNWMDDMRRDHNFDYMKTWHYVNIEKGRQYTPNNDENIVNALNRAITALEHKDKLSDDDIRRSLLVIFHLVGDFHQPLHVGYGNDKGGNDVQVKYLSNPTNLHRVWDSEIIESENISANDCLQLYRNFSKSELAQLRVINVEGWISEPRSLLNSVYDLKDGNVIDRNYVDKNKKIVEQQLLIAGIRLSAVLEHVFKP